MTKDPKKVEEGKRLAEWNHQNREKLKSQSEPKLISSPYYSAGAIVAIGALGVLRYYIYQSKKTPKETPVARLMKLWFTDPRTISLEWSRL